MPPVGVGRHACIQANIEHLLLEHVDASSLPSGQSDTPLQKLDTSMQTADVLQANRLGGQFRD